jgi:hypothetical protein
VARRSLGKWTLIPRHGRVADVAGSMMRVGTKARALARAWKRSLVRVNATETANVKMNDYCKLAYHQWHHHRYQPNCCCVASYSGLRMGPVAPRKQKGDSEMASPFLLPLPRWAWMGDVWNARAPNSAGATDYVFVDRIVSRVSWP